MLYKILSNSIIFKWFESSVGSAFMVDLYASTIRLVLHVSDFGVDWFPLGERDGEGSGEPKHVVPAIIIDKK